MKHLSFWRMMMILVALAWPAGCATHPARVQPATRPAPHVTSPATREASPAPATPAAEPTAGPGQASRGISSSTTN